MGRGRYCKMQFSQNIHRFYQYINSIYIMMIWGYEIVLNKVGSIAFADTLELRMCLFVKEQLSDIDRRVQAATKFDQ